LTQACLHQVAKLSYSSRLRYYDPAPHEVVDSGIF